MTSALFKNNVEQRQYEHDIDGQLVFAAYRLEDNTLFINHVEAPPSLRGNGAAGRLMEDVLAHAREQGYKVVPICGYAVAWIRRSGAYDDLLG